MKQNFRTITAASIGMGAWLVVSAASAADLAERRPVESVCRGGVLTDVATGQPILDPRKKDPTPVPCEEEANYWPLVPVGLVAVGLGACAAAGCFDTHTPPPFIPPPPLSHH